MVFWNCAFHIMVDQRFDSGDLRLVGVQEAVLCVSWSTDVLR